MLNIVDISKTINDGTNYNFVAVELRIFKKGYMAGFMFTLCVFAYCLVI